MPKAVLLSVAIFLASSAASAEVPCGQRDKIVDWLESKYQEEPVASGISSKGALIEVLSSVENLRVNGTSLIDC